MSAIVRESVRAFLLTATHYELQVELQISRDAGDLARERYVAELISESNDLIDG